MSQPSAQPAITLSASHAAQRRSRMISAVLTSGASKVFALLVQIFALPLALKVLGETRYTAFLTLQSVVGWISIFGLGLAPSLPKFIAAARAAGDRKDEHAFVMTAIIATLLLSALAFAGLSAIGALFGPVALVPMRSIPVAELQLGFYAAAAISCLSLFGSIDPAIRAGSHELHRANICALIANVVVLLDLFVFARHSLPLWAFFVLLNLPIALFQLLDLIMLLFQRPYLARGGFSFVSTIRRISSHSGNALLIQMSFALIVYIPTVAMAHFSTAHETAVFGSIALEMFFALASLNLIFQPLTQAMANAHSHNDADWVRHGYARSLLLLTGIGLLAAVLGGTIGPWVTRIWLGHGVEMSHLLGAAFGIYFMVASLALLHFYALSALGGLPGVGKWYMVQGLIAISLGSLLCVWYGALGMVAGLTLGLLTIGWLFPIVMRREIRSMLMAGAAQEGVCDLGMYGKVEG